MFIPIKLIPKEMQKQYHLEKVLKDGKVYVKIHKDMYGLPQTGIV